MKILFVSSSSGSRGGGELYLLFLAETFVSQGAVVGLWCSSHPRMDELADSFAKFGKVFRSPYENTYDYAVRSIYYVIKKRVEGIGTVIEEFNPDIVHVNKQNIEDGLDLLQTLDALKVTYVTTIHITQTQKSLGALLGWLRDSVSRKILQRARSLKWITISASRSRDLTVFFGNHEDKIIMIPNGVKVEMPNEVLRNTMREKLQIPKDNLVVIAVGRLESQKDPFKFIEWAVQCLKTDERLNFYWIGDGRLRREFEEKICSLQLNEKIICLGWQKQVAPFYTMADIYIHTASYEGLPFSILEAMSGNLPVVVSSQLYHDLAFSDDVLYKDIEGMKLLINDRQLITTVGKRSHDYVMENFSLDKIAKSYLTVYENVLQ